MTAVRIQTRVGWREAPARSRSRSIQNLAMLICKYAAAFLITAAFLAPFFIILATSFKPLQDVFANPPQILPRRWVLTNYPLALQEMPFLRYLANTAFLAALNVIGSLLSCSLVAYSLSRLRWRGRQALLVLILGTMMLPPQVTLIPIYLLWSKAQLTGTYWPLILPQFLGTPFYIFMLRQFFMTIPTELVDAARADGASALRVFFEIILPLAKPALATVAVFQFVSTWTDFLYPLIYLNDSSNYTLSIGLYSFFADHSVEWGALMAASALFTIPTIVLFAFAQRLFVEGIATTGFK